MTGGLGESSGDAGAVTDLPWASVFDPTANARALSAIQAEGFRAASQLVDRLVHLVDGPAARAPDTAPTAPSVPQNGSGSSDLERMTAAWWGMFGQLLLRPLPGMAASSAGLDLRAGADGGITLTARPGAVVESEVWLHNRTTDDMGVLALRCSDLFSHDGLVIGAPSIAVDPNPLAMPARCSRAAGLRVSVAADAPDSVFRGTLLVAGHPELWLPVVVRVRAA